MFQTSAERARFDGRAERKFWSWSDDDYVIREVSGFNCGPQNPDAWWVPELGFTAWEGQHLFRRREDAVAEARSRLENQIAQRQAWLSVLQ